jgi:phosphoketolase
MHSDDELEAIDAYWRAANYLTVGLGYVLSHAFGAVFDNPDLIAVAVVGDGEAETGREQRARRPRAWVCSPEKIH